MPAGTQAAQICLNEEETPNALFPKSNKTGTINPIKGPAIYQGQGCVKKSIFVFDRSVQNSKITFCSLARQLIEPFANIPCVKHSLMCRYFMVNPSCNGLFAHCNRL